MGIRCRIFGIFKTLFALLVCYTLVINVYFHSSDRSVVDPFEMQKYLNQLSKKRIADKIRNHKPLERNPESFTCNDTHEPEEFIQVEDGLYVYSAFYDTRKKGETYVRIMALTKQTQQFALFCSLRPKVRPIQMTYYNFNENHRGSFGGGIFSSRVPENEPKPCRVYVFVDDELKISLPLHYTDDVAQKDFYGICTPLFNDKIELSRFVEFMELSQILGASYFVIYKDDTIGEDVNTGLNYYQDLGLVSVLPWKLPRFQGSLWQHAEILFMNDCMYRSIGKVKFVSFNRASDFIVPTYNHTMVDFLRSSHTWVYCGYCIGAVYFENRRSSYGSGIKLMTQRSKKRSRQASRYQGHCIVQPDKIFEVGFHHVSKPNEERYVVKAMTPLEALVYKFTKCVQGETLDILCIAMMEDRTMGRYEVELRTAYEDNIVQINSR
ncbi:predicted protein [Nematostella vectensis]|uniref:Glycosyltransferase family 92 protein n=1 Tax=Nematostella vectensis TaxID=45351 RepID=A7SGP6_NEMVE|nr:beta-1,4-galactosyltransferase galt-1 [Nematostella vectensis]EDO37127.1 predicted protein [Nematostella vectensis]|eukprot:XP_001629190.1 predicted protein [Nematostella vectensis]